MMENEVVVHLPEEVIREILLRLPIKSLLKLRCVSKSWRSLISSHQFAMAHLNISSNKNEKLIFGSNHLLTRKVKNVYTCSVSSVSELTTDLVYSVDDENSVYDELLDCLRTKIGSVGIWIVGSCNGLVCLTFTGYGIILWNPAIGKCKKLPYSGTRFGCYFQGTSHGFGYDKVHDDYKVVEFSRVNNSLKVYSRRSHSWKVFGNWPGGDASRWPGQFLNGAIHWSVRRSNHWFIVAQDLASDEFVELPLPNYEFEGSNVTVVVKVEIIDGCVALYHRNKTHLDVWVMKEYGVGESWIKETCLTFSQDLDRHFIIQPFQPHPLLFFGDGRILVNFGRSLRIYDSTNPQPHQLCVNLEEVSKTTYVESLVSPSLDEADVCCSTSSIVM